MYLNNLQTIIFAIILSLFVMFIACSKSTTDFNTNVEYIEKLNLGEEKSFGNRNDFFKVKFESLNDSRCPINARCVRAGDAIVNLAYEDAVSYKYTATFKIGESSDFNPDTLELKINKDVYRVVLEDVLPHPEIGKDTIKTVTFRFYKL